MSAKNIELVRRLLDMFARREHEAVFAFYDPDIEWDATHFETRGLDELGGVYHGHEGVRTYWRGWLSAWKDLDFELQDVLDAGDEVVALIRNQRQWGRHRASSPRCPHTGWYSRFVRARSCGGAHFRTSSRPSKPPGCRSRRCRRRTSKSCAGSSKRSDRAGSMRLLSSGIPTSTGGQLRAAADDVGIIRGRDGVRRYYEGWIEVFDGLHAEVEEVILDAGEQVAVVVHHSGRGRSSGVRAEGRYFVVCKVQDGQITSGREFETRDTALEAAGLQA